MLHQVSCLLCFSISSIFYSISSSLSLLIRIIPLFFSLLFVHLFILLNILMLNILYPSYGGRGGGAVHVKTRLPSKSSGVRITARKGFILLLQRLPKVPPLLVQVFIPGSKADGVRI